MNQDEHGVEGFAKREMYKKIKNKKKIKKKKNRKRNESVIRLVFAVFLPG